MNRSSQWGVVGGRGIHVSLVDSCQDSGFFERDKKLLEDSEVRCGMIYCKRVILAAVRGVV